jgi:hypothetical protein
MEASTRIVGRITASLTAPNDLSRAEQLAALSALAWNVGILVWIPTLASRRPALRDASVAAAANTTRPHE